MLVQGWIEDIKATQGVSEFAFPIIADEKRTLAVKFGMLDPGILEAGTAQLDSRLHAERDSGPEKLREINILWVCAEEKDSAGMPFTCRAVFIISPDKKLKLSV